MQKEQAEQQSRHVEHDNKPENIKRSISIHQLKLIFSCSYSVCFVGETNIKNSINELTRKKKRRSRSTTIRRAYTHKWRLRSSSSTPKIDLNDLPFILTISDIEQLVKYRTLDEMNNNMCFSYLDYYNWQHQCWSLRAASDEYEHAYSDLDANQNGLQI